jgi:hypothetical protein
MEEPMASDETKSEQISFKVDEKMRSRLRDAAIAEDLKTADFTRKIARWGIEQYERAGSLHALRQMKIPMKKPPQG